MPTKNEQLKAVIEDYLGTVQTRNGIQPTEAQKAQFRARCLLYNLNPLKNQACLVGFDSNSGPQFHTIIQIEGLRAIATRTKEYAGCELIKLEFDQNKQPLACQYRVYRKVQGEVRGFDGPMVFLQEVIQTKWDGTPNAIWSKRPIGQLQKCAEASALRVAFSDTTAGLYITEEMPLEDEAYRLRTETKQLLVQIAQLTKGDPQQLERKILPISLEEANEKQLAKINSQLQVIIDNAGQKTIDKA